MLGKVRQFREEMATLQTRLQQATDITASRSLGMGGGDVMDGDLLGLSEEEKLRQQVMLGTESLERSSQSIVR